MKIQEIISVVEEIAPLNYQESYDNSGLILGNVNDDVTGILLSLDCIETVVEEAIQKQCSLIICHHPIVFSGIKKLNGKNYIERTLLKAIKNDIAIYAAHTNIDNVINGVNSKIAEKIGLTNCQILAPKKEMLKKLVTFCPDDKADQLRTALFEAGAGHIGNYDNCSFNTKGLGTFRGNASSQPYVGEKGEMHRENETRIETIFPIPFQTKIIEALHNAHPYEEVAFDIYSLDNRFDSVGSGIVGELENPIDALNFLNDVKKKLNTKCIRYTDIHKKNILRVAICGGSGSFLLNHAVQAKADVFITADYKYHQFFDADNKIIIADVGHYESEQYTKELFYDILNKNFATFAIHFSEINTNPVNYL